MSKEMEAAHTTSDQESKEVYDAVTVQDRSTQSEIDAKELARVIRKVDWRLLPPLGILYLFSYLDRSALANASIFGFRDSLGINVTQYNLITTIFFIPYALLEIPSNIVVSFVRASVWITILCATWGTVMTLSGLVTNFHGAMAARFFLGVAEAGFFPGALSLVGDWYPRHQLQSRISAFYVVGVFSGAFAGLLAYGINGMDGVGGLESWRWIFILEGIATVCLAPIILFYLPDSPDRCHFLTEAEKDIIVASRAANGNMAKNHFEWKYLSTCARDYKIYMTTWLSSAVNIAIFGFIYTLPTILTQLGYAAANAQLMTIPVYGVACVCTVISAIVSDKIKMRTPGIFVGFTIGLVGLIMLYCLPKDSMAQVRYFGCILFMAGTYSAFPGTITLASNNAESRGKRNIAVALQMTIASLATIAGTNSYVGAQAPYYQAGFGLSIGMVGSSMVVTAAYYFLMKRENKKLDELEAMGLTKPGVEPGYRYIL